MPTIQENNKRIAKNTLLLYVRLFITMAIGLFTSRVVLNTLGISDYGINNAVAGFVTMFGLLTGSLSSAISRYINVSLGKNDLGQLKTIFSTSLIIMSVMAVIVVAIAEPFGIWFLNTQMNIPEGRMYAANWVLQMSLLSFVLGMITVPYNATIIAHEKMDVFAYISILQVTLKLLIVYMLYVSPFDKLVTYTILFTSVDILIRIIYGIYCKRHFEETHFHWVYDRSLIKNMGSFAGWNLFSSGTIIFNTQGINMLMNIFFGVTANAARGVANQVEGIIKSFVTNFTTAINPQIMKSYASGDVSFMYSLVCRGAKFSFLLMLFFVVPFMFETETILRLWLKNYPPEAPAFLRLSLIGTMFDMLGNSLANAAWATGKIKRYYLFVGTTLCFVFPLSWIAFYVGFPAYTSYIIFSVAYFGVMFFKVNIVNKLTGLPKDMFYKNVYGRIFPVTIISVIIPSLLYVYMTPGLMKDLLIILVCFLSTGVTSFMIGFTHNERVAVVKIINNKLHKQ